MGRGQGRRTTSHATLALTDQAAAQGARLVVWPESSRALLLRSHAGPGRRATALARQYGIYLLFGNDDRETAAGAERVWVGAKMLTPAGELRLRYHKIRLVPFGEYVPMQSLLTLGGRVAAKLVQEVAGLHARHRVQRSARSTAIPSRRFICYEAIFPDLVRQFRGRGAELLVNITNDAWYGTNLGALPALSPWPCSGQWRTAASGARRQHRHHGGRGPARQGPGADAALRAHRAGAGRPLRGRPTFYARHGDVFAWGCLAAAWPSPSARGPAKCPTGAVE